MEVLMGMVRDTTSGVELGTGLGMALGTGIGDGRG